MHFTKKFLLWASFLMIASAFSFFLAKAPAYADDKLLETSKSGGFQDIGKTAFQTSSEPTDVRLIVSKVIKFLLGFLGIVFTALIIFAGWKYMTAQGDSGQAEDALGMIRTGVIGLVIIVAAYGIAVFVTDKLFSQIIQ